MGLLLLVVAGSGIGFYKAYELKRRIADIIMLQNAFRLLETEIYYTLTPVPSALVLLAPRLPAPIQNFFQQVCIAMEREHQPLYQAWENGLQIIKSQCFVHKEELSAIQNFGLTLGTGSAQEQEKNFQLLMQRLQCALEHAEERRTQQARIWQYMGVCVSAAAALLLC